MMGTAFEDRFDDGEGEPLLVKAPLKRVLSLANPVLTPPWEDADDLRPEHVWAALDGREPTACGREARRHAMHIAWLMVLPAWEPILLEFGVPSRGCHVSWAIQDGNHRTYAAALKGDEFIDAEISGCIRTAEERLRIRIPARG